MNFGKRLGSPVHSEVERTEGSTVEFESCVVQIDRFNRFNLAMSQTH